MPSPINVRNCSPELRVLLLESDRETAALLARELEAGLPARCQRVDSKEAFVGSLRGFAPDLILTAPSVPGLGALAVLPVVQVLRPAAPVIVVAATLDEQIAVACLRAGAETVVLTDHLSRLVPTVRRALAIRLPLRKLTRRQLEVLRLVSEGRTTRQIAERLSVSVKTVETHRGAMTKRLGIREIAQQARYAVRVGLVPEGNPRDLEPVAA